MRISLTASLFLALGLILPVSMSVWGLSEDLEGSGFDLDGSGSGVGDVSEQASPGESKNIKNQSNNKELSVNSGTRKTLHGSSVETFDNSDLLVKDDESEFIFEGSTKSFLDSKEILFGLIAGGVTGGVSAATLGAILIYKWQHEDGGYVLGQRSV